VAGETGTGVTSVRNSLTATTRVMGVGTAADPIEALDLQTCSGVIIATNAIATGGSAETVATTGIGIATGVAAGSHS